MKLSENFSLEEFAQKAGHGCNATDYPADWVLSRLVPLAHVLEAVRAALSQPMHIISGYRSPKYNAAIGGARLSQHMSGMAADVIVDGFSAASVHDCVLGLSRAGKLGVGGLGRYPGFTHVDIRPSARLVRWTGSRG